MFVKGIIKINFLWMFFVLLFFLLFQIIFEKTEDLKGFNGIH